MKSQVAIQKLGGRTRLFGGVQAGGVYCGVGFCEAMHPMIYLIYKNLKKEVVLCIQ